MNALTLTPPTEQAGDALAERLALDQMHGARPLHLRYWHGVHTARLLAATRPRLLGGRREPLPALPGPRRVRRAELPEPEPPPDPTGVDAERWVAPES